MEELRKQLETLMDASRRIQQVLLGDLDGRTGLIQATKNHHDELKKLVEQLEDHSKRVKALEASELKRATAAAVIGFVVGVGATWFKTFFSK